jgi:hypothetical protein
LKESGEISNPMAVEGEWRNIESNGSGRRVEIYQGRQSSCPVLAKLKILPGSLPDLSA